MSDSHKSETARRPRSYWQSVSLHGGAKDVLRSWFTPLADRMDPYRADVLCDIGTDREKKLRAFMIDEDGRHYQLVRTRQSRGRWTITMKRIEEPVHA